MHLFVISVLLVFGFPFIMTKVVESFEDCSQFFLDQQPPDIPSILVAGASQDNNRYKKICQQYKNVYRFAALYDTWNKIPVFSAYKYTGHYKGRPHIQWKIEPQLEALDAYMRVPCINQAHTADYMNTEEVDRGHLSPNSHAADKDTAESTFTLTNIVPQHKTFNGGSWLRMEENVRSIMDFHCRDEGNLNNVLAFVLTGAVPSQTNLLHNKVNIPSFMWTVFCCYNHQTNKWESQAHWAENQDESVNTNIDAKNLENLQEFLNQKYGSGAILFNNKCADFLTTSDQIINESK